MLPEKMEEKTTVCVTGASGLVGSYLVMRLLERGYLVRATIRDPGNEKKVKHLLELPNASTNLSLWKADLTEEGSYDDAIQGCQGVFHLATTMELLYLQDAEDTNEVINSTVNGLLSVMKASNKAGTVKRFVYASSIAAITYQPQVPDEYTESDWTDIDFCHESKWFGWVYCVAKATAEKAAWKYAEETGLDMVTVLPSLVVGHFTTPYTSYSIDVATSLYTKNERLIPLLNVVHAVHLDDVCNAHIYLFECPLAEGRYICSTHTFNIFDIAHSLSRKYPDKNIQTEFEGFEKSPKVPPCSSKKLMDLGFEFAHKDKDNGGLCAETIESCREKGLL